MTDDVKGILAAERAAQNSIQLEKESRNQKWMALTSFDWTQNQPALVAMILTEPPYGYTMPLALAVTMTCMAEGANPFTNDVYVISGKISFSVQFKLKKARAMGMALGVPKYSFSERDWPTGKVNPGAFKKDRGCTCHLPIGTDAQEQTVWLSTAFKPSDPWRNNPDHMLQVRALDYCLRFTGIGISEPIDSNDAEDTKIVESKVVAPTKVPMVQGA
jgi:hypothetical protein